MVVLVDVGLVFILCGTKCKTDISKRRIAGFGGKVLTDEKSGRFCLRSIFNPTHHSLSFFLGFLAVRTDLV